MILSSQIREDFLRCLIQFCILGRVVWQRYDRCDGGETGHCGPSKQLLISLGVK